MSTYFSNRTVVLTSVVPWSTLWPAALPNLNNALTSNTDISRRYALSGE
jgi:hypothetical protein